MNNLYKSYTLNLSAFCGFLFLCVFGKPMVDGVIHQYTGILNVWGFIFVPVGLAIFIGTLVGLGWEYLAKLLGFRFPFNFPYKIIPLQPLYYLFFYVGLFGMFSPLITALFITLV